MESAQIQKTDTSEMVTISRAEYEKLKAQVEVLTVALRLARHKQFGASSEKSEESLIEQLSFLFNEAEVFAEAKAIGETEAVAVAAHKRHKKHEYTLDTIPEGITVKQVEHRLEGEALVRPQCGSTLTESCRKDVVFFFDCAMIASTV